MKYLAKEIIDTSGDADVMYRAGADCTEQDSIVSHWCFEADFETLKAGLEEKGLPDVLRQELAQLHVGGPEITVFPEDREAEVFSDAAAHFVTSRASRSSQKPG